ncbi:MAG TPA: hypothetical protein VLH10_25195 [Yinghuangia sp.]|uniref:hypothetical protein n=1 Tax=Yinghuangia sp. YIM S10712 TaxID=3436930 RepID=UPI002CDF6749|nr:hypothetical protein [Yinghuangia sp.]
MTHITRRVAQSALLIAAAGMAPLLGASSAHADAPLDIGGALNGVSAPDAPAVGGVADKVPGAGNLVQGTGAKAGDAVQGGVPATVGSVTPVADKVADTGTASVTPSVDPNVAPGPQGAPPAAIADTDRHRLPKLVGSV